MSKGMKIPSSMTQQDMRRFIVMAGFVRYERNHLPSAEDAAESMEPDIGHVISDIKMPGIRLDAV